MRGVVGAYRRLLRNGPLSRLLLGEFVSSIGDWLYLVALLIIIYDRTQDAVVLGIVGAVRVLPYVFLSIPAGIVADRFDRRLVLLVTDVARGICQLILAFLVATNGPIEAIVVVVVLATCFSSFFGPAIGAYLPSLVKDESDLGPANSAYASLDNIAFILGPALAALLISAGGLTLAFLLNALSFAVIAVVLWGLPPSRGGAARAQVVAPTGTADAEQGAAAASVAESSAAATSAAEADARPAGALTRPDAAEPTTAQPAAAAPPPASAQPATAPEPTTAAPQGWRAYARPIAALTAIDVVAGFVFGGLGVLTVIIAYDQLNAGEAGTGALNAAVGVGGLIGALVSSALVLRRKLAPPLLLGAVVMGIGVAFLGFGSSVALAMVAMAAAALGSMLLSVVDTTLFQRIVPDEVRGRILGIMTTVAVLAYAAGSFILPALAESVDLAILMGVSGLAVVVVSAAAIPLLGASATQAPPADAVRARLSAVPIFAGLSPARVETAERRSHVVPMRAGEVVIRQGDEADRFYIIVAGQVEVTQVPAGGGEARVLRRMGETEVFGEIGLLTGVPRTATVTVVTDGTLLALDKADFLDLVGSGAGLTFPILDIHRGAATQQGQAS